MPYGTALIILVLAAMLHALRTAYLKDHRSKAGGSVDAIGWPLTLASLAVLVFALGASVAPQGLGVFVIVAESAILCLAATADFASRLHFGISPWKVYRSLSADLFREMSWTAAKAYVVQYFPLGFLAWLTAAMGAAVLLTAWTVGLEGLSAWLALVIVFMAVGLWSFQQRQQNLRALSATERAFLTINPQVALFVLKAADRNGHVRLNKEVRCKPNTIVLIINESAGYYLPSSEGPAVSLQRKLLNLSGHPAQWFVPSNAVTNSSCTDVSIPSLLTGAGPHESAEKLHRMPFVFDVAKARGYRTAFFTSSTLQWANFDKFFSTAKIDELFTAESSGLPYINDLTVDDIVPTMRLAERITQTDGPIFAVLYTNALHLPFQAVSHVDIPATLADRKSRALYIMETEHKILFDALTASQRYDDALIVTVGDHGERLNNPLSNKWTVPRLENYSEPILRPLFLIKPPRDLPAEMSEALRCNADALIANMDIAPSLADMLGVSLVDGLTYEGYSLFREIPSDRLAIAISTNEWRSWSRGAVAVMRGQGRLVCDSHDLCQYFDAADVGNSSSPQTDEARRDALMVEALRIPFVRESIAKIYRERFRAG